jgi:hypothetical protein
MTAHVVNKTQVLRITAVCHVCTNHSAALGWQWQPTHIPNSTAPHLRLLLLTGGIMQTYSRHQATRWHSLQADIARAPATGSCSKNCPRDWCNVYTPNAVNVLVRQIILGNCTMRLAKTMVCQLQLCRDEEVRCPVIGSLPHKA